MYTESKAYSANVGRPGKNVKDPLQQKSEEALQKKTSEIRRLLEESGLEPGDRLEFESSVGRVLIAVVPPSKPEAKTGWLQDNFGVWKDERTPDEIIRDIRAGRKNSPDTPVEQATTNER